ncbi:MAG: hypothetical protein V1911_01190 [Candidatus Micrarchaeota archaeon]
MTDRKILTDVDGLAEYVMKKGEVTSVQAAKRLKISEEMVEEWAEALEGRGLVKIEFSAISGMKIIAVKGGAENEGEKNRGA